MQPGPHQFGRQAERLAERYLRKKGFCIIDRNVRLPGGELDLVARCGPTMVFIEVKARRTQLFGGTAYAVNNRKRQRIIKLAMGYLAQHHLKDQDCRFDVVLYDDDRTSSPTIEHIVNAFEVPGEDFRW